MAPSTGKYRKGILKREEILTVALAFVAEHGYNQATVRELADAVGISKTGLMHHFESKEELFAEILRRRDTLDATQSTVLGDEPLAEGLPALFSRAIDVPGLVQLFARFSAEATDPAHSAHAYFVERYARSRELVALAVRGEQDAGRIDDGVDADALAAALLAAMDGLQIQWLLDPQLDMAHALSVLLHALGVARVPAQQDVSAAG